jgi:hypothetical protein
MNISVGEARRIIRGLRKGIIVPGGAKYIHCGYEPWICVQQEEMNEVEEDGGAIVHFVRGSYGEGKTHFLRYIEDSMEEQGWAVAHIECKQDNVDLDHFETFYPKIVQKLHFRAADFGEGQVTKDPATVLLELWTEFVLRRIGHKKDAYVNRFLEAESRVFEFVRQEVMSRNLPGNLQTILCAYPRAHLNDDYNSMKDMENWLKGEPGTIHIPMTYVAKPGQRIPSPGVSPQLVRPHAVRPISRVNSFDAFRGLLWVLRQCGVKGLVLSVDEIEQIARLSPAVRRERALQALREFVDNTDAEIGLQYLSLYLAATPVMFDDEKYFKSYDALASRIDPVSDHINYRSTVINLEKTPLSKVELLTIAEKIYALYAAGYEQDLGNQSREESVKKLVETVSKSTYRVAKPRLLCKMVVDYLDREIRGEAPVTADTSLSSTADALIREANV